MTLHSHFARLVRKVLTPYRKKVIINRVLSRIKKADILAKISDFQFKIYPNKNKFGIVISICDGDYEMGYLFRCGCYAFDETLQDTISYHKETTDHGKIITINDILTNDIYSPTRITLPTRTSNFRGSSTSPKPNAKPKSTLGRPRKKIVEE